jgi:hypothetical protein
VTVERLEIIQRAAELVLMRHGVPESDLSDSHSLAATIAENEDNVAGISTAIFLSLQEHGVEEKEGGYDDAVFLSQLATRLTG